MGRLLKSRDRGNMIMMMDLPIPKVMLTKIRTPEDLVKEIVRLRDERKPYVHIYNHPLADEIPNYIDVSSAIARTLTLEEVLKRMEGKSKG